MLQILPALPCAPLVTGLILGRDQRVGAAAPFGREVEVARGVPDALLDMGAPVLDRFQAPLPLLGVKQERAQRAAVSARAFQGVGPGPVAWRFQGKGDAPAQMIERRVAEPPERRPCRALGLLGD